MFTATHGIEGNVGVHVVRSGYGYGIDRVTQFSEHLSEVLKHRGIRLQSGRFFGSRQVDIAKTYVTDLIMIGHESGIGKSFARGPDGRYVQFRVEIAAPHDSGSGGEEC